MDQVNLAEKEYAHVFGQTWNPMSSRVIGSSARHRCERMLRLRAPSARILRRRGSGRSPSTTSDRGTTSARRVCLDSGVLVLEWKPVRLGRTTLDRRAPGVSLGPCELGPSERWVAICQRSLGTGRQLTGRSLRLTHFYACSRHGQSLGHSGMTLCARWLDQLCRSSIQRTSSGASAGSMSRLKTSPVWPLLASTQ